MMHIYIILDSIHHPKTVFSIWLGS